MPFPQSRQLILTIHLLVPSSDGQVCTAEMLGPTHSYATMHRCIDTAIAAGSLPDWQMQQQTTTSSISVTRAEEREQHSLLLSAWFLILFILRHSCGHTLVQIPYDALGQELTNVAGERERLFAWKSLSNFAGLLSAYMV